MSFRRQILQNANAIEDTRMNQNRVDTQSNIPRSISINDWCTTNI